MELETLLWIIGANFTTVVAFFFKMAKDQSKIGREVSELLAMHRDPDEYGFGTEKTNKIISDNTRVIEALTHYFKWFVEQQTGAVPPPPTP
jgi:hypothetical protein